MKHVKKASKKPAGISTAELRKYADEYRRIYDSLKSTIARNDVEPRHIAKRFARSVDKAGRILLTLKAEDHEGPWRSLSKPDPAIGAVMFWGTDGLRWLRKQKPLLFDMPQGEFDPFSIRTDAKGIPLEGNVLAVLREQIEDHLSGCRAMTEILEAEIVKRGGEEKTPAAKKRRRRKYADEKETSRLTEPQQKAMELFAKHDGNISAGARAMGIDRKTFREHRDAVCQKLGVTPEKYLRLYGEKRPQKLPEGEDGQSDLYDAGFDTTREGRTRERRPKR